MEHGDTFVTGREQCPRCAEEGRDNHCDNLARYNDGHGYCYACKHYEAGNGAPIKMTIKPKDWKPIFGEIRAMPDRKIEEATCRKFGYQILNHPEKGEIHINTYYKNGNMIAQKYIQVHKHLNSHHLDLNYRHRILHLIAIVHYHRLLNNNFHHSHLLEQYLHHHILHLLQ